MTSDHDQPRRGPTAAEARALAHPTRLRIVFACRDRAMTNKELAAEIGTTPGTIHYHLRPLVAEGFLRAEEPRPGRRGSLEQPYRSTGKSWQVGGDPTTSRVLRQVGADEMLAAAEEDVLDLVRLGLTLPPKQLEEMLEHFHEVVTTWKARSVGEQAEAASSLPGSALENVTIFLAVHRQRTEG